jgi:hypothetical protein
MGTRLLQPFSQKAFANLPASTVRNSGKFWESWRRRKSRRNCTSSLKSSSSSHGTQWTSRHSSTTSSFRIVIPTRNSLKKAHPTR